MMYINILYYYNIVAAFSCYIAGLLQKTLNFPLK